MTKAFQKGKPRQSKINGQWIFGDFSEGLYLLDTPRSITEQLGSLALVGGRNVFCEKGALIPQYGYVEKAKIDGEYIVAISKDVESGYLFLLANTGNVFLYTPSEGLKRYKTQLTEVSENALMTCRQDELIISDNGKNILFGGYYGNDATITKAITSSAPINHYSYFSDIEIPNEDKDFYWLGKKVHLDGIGEGTVMSIKDGQETPRPTSFKFNSLSPDISWDIKGTIDTTTNLNAEDYIDKGSQSNSKIELGTYSSVNSYNTVITDKHTNIWETKEITYYSFYNDTTTSLVKVPSWYIGGTGNKDSSVLFEFKISNPEHENFTLSSVDVKTQVGEQLFGGSVYWRRKGSSIWNKATFPDNTVYRNNIQEDKFSIKSVVGMDIGNQIVYALVIFDLRRNTDGDEYDRVIHTEEVEEAGWRSSIEFDLPTNNGADRKYTFEGLQPDIYNYKISNNPATNTITVSISNNYGSTIPVHEFTANTGTLKEYYGESSDKETVGGKDSGIVLTVNGSDINYEIVHSKIMRVAHDNIENITVGDTINVSEKAYQEVTFEYVPEADIDPEEGRILQPKLIAWVCNRLFVEDMSGRIYYSEVGVADSFEEKYGAGYFYGFYGDNSELLSIEEYLGKVLLTKKNGMYTLVIGNTNSSYSEVAGTAANTDIAIKIDKIAELGQEYATDHVIVKEAIYAYDCNSASIVQAASQNVFGSIVAGTTLISADYLNAQNFGIIDRKRCLTYNSEAQIFTLYFGEDLTAGIVLTSQGSLFPRKLDRYVQYFIGFNQGVLGIMGDGTIFQDFKRNTVIPTIQPVAEFEAIGVKDNRLIMGSILEVTELNGIEYDIAVTNTDTSFQHIQPYTNYGVDGLNIPPLIYSDKRNEYPSFELQTKWAVKKSNLTRVYAPMSGREGVSITMQFPTDVAFCLAALRIPDFSQGE